MKLKEGYSSIRDDKKNILHIYPTEGRKHWLDDCWCSPTFNEAHDILSHNFMKGNNSYLIRFVISSSHEALK